MKEIKTFTGDSEAEIWKQVAADMGKDELLDYQVRINHGGHQTTIVVDVDLGGGFESGFEMTMLSALLTSNSDYKFAIHNEHFLDEIGKFFGMQDVELGYPEFNKKVIVKTNNSERTRLLFANPAARTFVNELSNNFTIGIIGSAHERKLEMILEKGINDVAELRRTYSFFYDLLTQADEIA